MVNAWLTAGERVWEITICHRHREELCDEAIQSRVRSSGLLRFARNDGSYASKIVASSQRRIDCLVIFLLQARDQFGGRHHLVDSADALPRAPDFLPRLRLVAFAGRVGAET